MVTYVALLIASLLLDPQTRAFRWYAGEACSPKTNQCETDLEYGRHRRKSSTVSQKQYEEKDRQRIRDQAGGNCSTDVAPRNSSRQYDRLCNVSTNGP